MNVGPETQERKRSRPFKARIGANESVFGPSPLAIEAMQRAAPEMWMYCDPDNLESVCKQHHDGEIQSEECLGFSKRVGADGWPVDPRHPENSEG